jgi:hypothetical protein
MNIKALVTVAVSAALPLGQAGACSRILSNATVSLPVRHPRQWVVDGQHVGSGDVELRLLTAAHPFENEVE